MSTLRLHGSAKGRAQQIGITQPAAVDAGGGRCRGLESRTGWCRRRLSAFDVSVWEFVWPRIEGSVPGGGAREGHTGPRSIWWGDPALCGSRQSTSFPRCGRCLWKQRARGGLTGCRSVMSVGGALSELVSTFIRALGVRSCTTCMATASGGVRDWYACAREGSLSSVPIRSCDCQHARCMCWTVWGAGDHGGCGEFVHRGVR